MSDKIELVSFPTSRFEALAMLYLQKQDLSQYTPEKLLAEYYVVLEKIKEKHSEIMKSR